MGQFVLGSLLCVLVHYGITDRYDLEKMTDAASAVMAEAFLFLL